MSTSPARSNDPKITKIEARLTWQDRTEGKILGLILGCGALGSLFMLPMIAGKSLFFPAFLPIATGVFFSLMMVALFWRTESTRLDNRDIDILLEADSSAAIPLLAEYHSQVRLSKRP